MRDGWVAWDVMDISVVQLVAIVAGSCTVGGVIVKVFTHIRAKGFREGERSQKLERLIVTADKHEEEIRSTSSRLERIELEGNAAASDLGKDIQALKERVKRLEESK